MRNFTSGIFLQQNNWSHLRGKSSLWGRIFTFGRFYLSDIRHQIFCWINIPCLEACRVLVLFSTLGQDLQETTLYLFFKLSGLPLQLLERNLKISIVFPE